MTKIWRERLHTGGWVALGVLLIGALIWSLLRDDEGKPRPIDKVTSITFFAPPPPPPPKKIVPQRVAKASPMAPASKPLPPMPQVTTPAMDTPLAMDTPVDSNPYQIPQGAADGGGNSSNSFTIGGGSGGDGCGGIIIKSFLTLINSQMMHAFENSRETNRRNFEIQARIWFDPSGKVRQSELVDSTGDTSLDAAITQVLGDVNTGENVPSCMQPINIRVREPWTGSFADARDKQTELAKHGQSETLIWRQSARR